MHGGGAFAPSPWLEEGLGRGKRLDLRRDRSPLKPLKMVIAHGDGLAALIHANTIELHALAVECVDDRHNGPPSSNGQGVVINERASR
jgi:hypothetical protein